MPTQDHLVTYTSTLLSILVHHHQHSHHQFYRSVLFSFFSIVLLTRSEQNQTTAYCQQLLHWHERVCQYPFRQLRH